MTLNCKQGDLAIIVKSVSGNEGKIVRCVRYAGMIEYTTPNFSLLRLESWEVDVQVKGCFGQLHRLMPDSHLRPLRGDLLNEEITTSKELEAV